MDKTVIRHKYCDLCTDLDDDSLPVAKEALTVMIVAFNYDFKLPNGHLLVNG